MELFLHWAISINPLVSRTQRAREPAVDQLQQSLTWARPEILRIPHPPRSLTRPCALHPGMTSLGQWPRLHSIKPYYAQEACREGVLHRRKEEEHRGTGNSPANAGKGERGRLSSQMKVDFLGGLSHVHLCSLTKRSRISYSCSKESLGQQQTCSLVLWY